MKLRPLHDQVIVKQFEVSELSKGGIVLAGDKTEKPLKGEVTAVGPGRYLDDVRLPMTVKVGDVVIFGKQSGTEVDVDINTKILVLRESEIVAVIE